MKTKLPEMPKWANRSLQGLVFWVGYRRSFFSGWPIKEAALVAEACNLIQANLQNQLILLPERMYKNLVSPGKKIKGVTGQARADLVLCCNNKNKPIDPKSNLSSHTRFVIEVKRGSAPKSQLDSDLLRLHNYLVAAWKGVRGFLLIVFESKAPKRFVENGKSRLGSYSIPKCKGSFRVRRTLKAATSFSKKKKAHYVCLIEVFSKI